MLSTSSLEPLGRISPIMTAEPNRSNSFTPFTLPLANHATLTGIAHIPPLASWKGPHRPLIVALHGGTCSAHHYDISPHYTSATASECTGIPIVSINRPCYAGTSSFLPLSADNESQSFSGMTAIWLHEYILPKIWDTFGVPNKCAGIVLLSHSLAVPPSILTAAMFASDPGTPKRYHLAGLILSGFGAPDTTNNVPNPLMGNSSNEIIFPPETKRLMMVSELNLHCAEISMLPLIDALTSSMPVEELEDMLSWPYTWERAAQHIELPVLHRMGEHDWLWKSDQESMDKFCRAFKKATRFDSGVVSGAPHALEMWSKANQWYDVVFRFAREACQ